MTVSPVHAGRVIPQLSLVFVMLGGVAMAFVLALNTAGPSAASWLVGGLLAGAIVAATVSRPRWALLLLLAVEVSNTSGVFGQIKGVSVYVAVLAVATMSLVLGVMSGRLRVRLTPVFLLAAVWVASQAPSLLTARDPGVAWGDFVLVMKDLWFLFLVVTLAVASANAWTIARLFTAIMTVLAGLSLINQYILHNSSDLGGYSVVAQAKGVGIATARHAGPLEDPNFWGRLLLLAVPLALSLAAESWQRRAVRATALWGGTAVVLCGGLYLTQSRGAFLGLACVMVVWLALAGPKGRRALLLLPPVAVALALLPGVGSRVGTLEEVGQASSGLGDYSLVERRATQEISMAMFVDNPALGVGLGNIPVAWDEYRQDASVTVRRQVAPHNFYLQLAAEGGLLALTGWFIFFGGVLVIALRILIMSPAAETQRAPPERILAVGAIASMVGWGVASIFLHLTYLRLLLIVVAAVAVLDLQTPRKLHVLPSRAPRAEGAVRRGLVTAAVLLVGLVVAGSALHSGLTRPAWEARTTIAVQPKRSGDPYSYDVLTRAMVLPTYTAIVEHAGQTLLRHPGLSLTSEEVRHYHLRVTRAADSALVTLDLRGPERRTTSLLVQRLASAGAEDVNSRPAVALFAAATPVNDLSVRSVREWSLDRLGMFAGILLAVGLAIRLVSRPVRRRP